MNSDCNLFSRLYLACQTRDGDVNTFFCHENHHWPLSLSLGVKLRLGSNADTLPYFEVETASSEESPPVDAQFIDGAAVVQVLNPGTAKTFLDHTVHVFCNIRTRKSSTGFDIVWDVHQTMLIDEIWAKVCGDQLFYLH